MRLFRISIQELDDDGKQIEGHFVQSVLSDDQITGKGDTMKPSLMEFLLGLAASGELNPKPTEP